MFKVDDKIYRHLHTRGGINYNASLKASSVKMILKTQKVNETQIATGQIQCTGTKAMDRGKETCNHAILHIHNGLIGKNRHRQEQGTGQNN